MPNRRATSFSLALALAWTACASGANRGGDRRDPNLITADQIATNRFRNAFDAVEALHSNWLRARGTDSFSSPGQVLVYMDDVRLGGVETLRSIVTTGILSIRYFDGIAAAGRWGLDHGNGVIFVSTHL